ncbi:hypothetical protein [Halostella litorea]|uniref:hypothetical protein n=1 Tax=Halostella litorea TaxID=2528831 RepID=UPI001091946D|nr:hypothetical protein [Halostella litorea]
MNGSSRDAVDDWAARTTAVARRCGRAVFGDYAGLFVFLLACTAAMVLWRTTFSITDNLTVANGLVAVSDGHMHVAQPTYGDTLATPGMYEIDGRAYPRNYAQIAVALPVLWAFDAVAAVADVRIALAALWSLLLFATASVGGRLVGRRETAHLLGGGVALAAFAANVALATPFPYENLAYTALQFATVLASAATALVAYRLLVHAYESSVGLAAGVAVGVASPALLWATIPKRHVLTGLFAFLTLYCLYRSRGADGESSYRGYRAAAYVPVGLTAWLNASEGLVLFGALLVADAVTAREHGLRTLATVAAGFALSLLPFLLTNYLVSGDPFAPPRMLDRYGSAAVDETVTEEASAIGDDLNAGDGGGEAAGGESGGTGGDGSGSTGSGGNGSAGNGSAGNGSAGSEGGGSTEVGGDGTERPGATGGDSDGSGGGGSSGVAGGIDVLLGRVSALWTGFLVRALGVFDRVVLFTDFLSQGVDAVRQEPERLYHAFVRSGYFGFSSGGATGLAINVAFLEAFPVAGVLLTVPVVAARRGYRGLRAGTAGLRSRPLVAADVFVASYAVLITLLYIYRLPLHATLTVRYVYPLFPLAVYGAARLPCVRAAVTERGTWLAFAYAGSVLVGGQLVAIAVVTRGYTADETIQGLALLALGVMAALVAWALSAAFDRTNAGVGAVLLGVGGGVATVLMCAFALLFFGPTGEFVLPILPR